MKNTVSSELKELYQTKKAEQPNIRIRDAAKQLDVTELELLELELGGNVIRLKNDFQGILKDIKSLGYVMALTRNNWAVHERKGVYDNISFMKNAKMGVAVNPDIDLRFLMANWRYAYAVRLEKGHRTMFSVQFFSTHGEAIHKIYLTGRSNPEAYQALIKKYKSRYQNSPVNITSKPPAPAAEKPDEAIDVEGFRKGWLALQDTHDFFPLLKNFEVSRRQALRLAPEGLAYEVKNESIIELFEQAAAGEVPIMVFLNSPGCIQIHTGPVKKLVMMKNWFNVMDKEFNLHLNMDGVHASWVVKKPTKDGMVHSLELFDADGKLIVYCFGKRKPGLPELESWKALIDKL
ncbi:MAG: ChuX/HutX family heme-like substrate-binding protein [Bacteroidota bacterium]